MSTTTPTTLEIKQRSGRCGWLCGINEARMNLGCGRGAGLWVEVATQRGPVLTRYIVTAHEDEKGVYAYSLLKEDDNGNFTELRTVDVSFGPDLADWSCDCQDSRYRASKEGRKCKHAKSLHAALSKIGM